MTPEGDPIEVEHDQTIRLGEMRIFAELGIADDLGIAVAVPVRLVDSEIRYIDDEGNRVAIADGDIHHRNETLTGIADPWVLAHRRIHVGRYTFDLRGGLSLPLGETEDNPFTPEAETMPHQHVQFGTGTFNPIVGIEVDRSGFYRAHFLTQQVLYENDRGYMAGDRYVAGIGITAPGLWRIWTELGVDLQYESAERWDSTVHTDDGNQGRTDVVLVAALSRRFFDVDVRVGGRKALYTHVVGGQLEYDGILEVGISRSFDLFGGDEHAHEHEHDHDHHHEHEDLPPPSPSLDISDLTDSGDAVSLTPTPDKITVFDFWAQWCEPCHDLDRMLRDLATRHPTRLAIRRINVVDWDTPAAARYLTPGGFNLPHIKVLSPDGRLLLEKSAPPHDLVRDLEALLR